MILERKQALEENEGLKNERDKLQEQLKWSEARLQLKIEETRNNKKEYEKVVELMSGYEQSLKEHADQDVTDKRHKWYLGLEGLIATIYSGFKIFKAIKNG